MSPEQLQATADQMAQRAIEMNTTSGSFSQMLEDAIMDRLNYNQDLIESREGAVEENLALPAILREEYGRENLNFLPSEENAMIARRRQAVGTRLGSILGALEERKFNLADLVGRGTTAYATQSEEQRMLAQLAQERADRALAAQERARAAAAQAAMLAAQRQQNDWYKQQSALPEVVSPGTTDISGTRTTSPVEQKVGERVYGALFGSSGSDRGGSGQGIVDNIQSLGLGGTIAGGAREAVRPTGGQTFKDRVTQNLALLNPFSWGG